MGLFDKRKKGDDFDSPVENIDLSAPPAEPEPQVMATATPQTSAPEARQIEAEPPPDEDFDVPPYGIDDAIQLMRALPGDNVELVVQVVKRTLESTKVKVKTIIDDASRKQSDIEGRIDVLKKEITEYEQEIAVRKEEISKLEADHKETTMVKDRLELAEKLSDKPQAKPAPARPAASSTTPPPAGGPTPPRAKPATMPPPSAGAPSTGSSGSSPGQPKPADKGTTIVAKK